MYEGGLYIMVPINENKINTSWYTLKGEVSLQQANECSDVIWLIETCVDVIARDKYHTDDTRHIFAPKPVTSIYQTASTSSVHHDTRVARSLKPV